MKKSITLIAAVVALAACQKTAPVQPIENQAMPVNLSMGLETKVSDTSFDQGDKVAVYMVNYAGDTPGTLLTTGNHYDCQAYTLGSVWSGETMYWLDKTTKADFYAFHPYAVPSDVNAHHFQAAADQSALASYKASDFVWGRTDGVAPTKEAVIINTKHILCNVKIIVKPGDGFTAETLAAADLKVRVNDVLTEAVIDLADGSVTASGTASDVIPYDEGEYYRAVIVPQTIADDSELIVLTVNGVDYALKKGFSFRQGVKHKFTVTVNKTGNGINIGVSDWEEDEEDNGGSAE